MGALPAKRYSTGTAGGNQFVASGVVRWYQPLCQSSVNRRADPLTQNGARPYSHFNMQDKDFDELLSDYRSAVDNWVTALKAEEALANDDHSMVEMEKWDAAGFTAHDAEAVAKKARDRYKNALRKKNYGF
jgi:hypothetical protein